LFAIQQIGKVMLKKWLVQAAASYASKGKVTPPWGVRHDNTPQMIEQGMAMIRDYLAVPGLGRIVFEEPERGVRILDREEEFEVYIMAVLALIVREAKWGTPRFYCNAKLGTRLHYTAPWRALERGCGQHMRPRLDRSHNVHCFHQEYYWLCQIILEVVPPPEMQGAPSVDFDGGGYAGSY
jgi:hypothetical protein